MCSYIDIIAVNALGISEYQRYFMGVESSDICVRYAHAP